MSDKKKIKDTKLGAWLSEKAPSILGVVGDLLPDSGALGVVKNLIDKDDSVDSEEGSACDRRRGSLSRERYGTLESRYG